MKHLFWIMQQASSNFAAKGAHRLSITLSLTTLTSTTDTTDFVRLGSIENGKSTKNW